MDSRGSSRHGREDFSAGVLHRILRFCSTFLATKKSTRQSHGLDNPTTKTGGDGKCKKSKFMAQNSDWTIDTRFSTRLAHDSSLASSVSWLYFPLKFR